MCRSAGGAFAGGAFAAGITCGMPGLWWLCLVSTDRSMHAPDAAEAEVRDLGRLCRRWRRRGGCCAGETTKAISCSTRWVRCCRFKPCVGGLGNGSEASVGADVSGCATAAALPRHICVCRACHHHVMPHIPPTHTHAPAGNLLANPACHSLRWFAAAAPLRLDVRCPRLPSSAWPACLSPASQPSHLVAPPFVTTPRGRCGSRCASGRTCGMSYRCGSRASLSRLPSTRPRCPVSSRTRLHGNHCGSCFA